MNLESRKQDFLDEAKEKWGERFNYDDIEYKTRNTNIKIICIKHKKYGSFEKTPKLHLKKKNNPYGGCKECKTEPKYIDLQDGEIRTDHYINKMYGVTNLGRFFNQQTGIFLEIKIKKNKNKQKKQGYAEICVKQNWVSLHRSIYKSFRNVIKPIFHLCHKLESNQDFYFIAMDQKQLIFHRSLYESFRPIEKSVEEKAEKSLEQIEEEDISGLKILHIDGDNKNNRLDNLKIGTGSEATIAGQERNRDTETPIQMFCLDIKCKIPPKEFDTITAAEKWLGVTRGGVSNCLNGRSTKSAGYRWKRKHPIPEKKDNRVEEKDKSAFKCIDGSEEEEKKNNCKCDEENSQEEEKNNFEFHKKECKCDVDKTLSDYFVNNRGEVASKKSGCLRYMIPSTSGTGYLRITCGGKEFRVHRLVGKVFLRYGHRKFYDINFGINHKDLNKENNNVTNLAWTTQQENAEHACGKAVNQLDKLTGSFIKRHNSAVAAAEDLGIKNGQASISAVCLGTKHYKTAYKYKWEFVDEEKKVAQLCLDPTNDEPIKIHNNAKAAAQDLDIEDGHLSILEVCKGKQETAHDCRWKFC